ncbi:MAG: hypothetical protein ACXVAX_03905 [Pseudobdellovibrio sp.]
MKISIILLSLLLSAPGFVQAEAPERPETSPSSPPLSTDDPDTPGHKQAEVNMISDCDQSSVDSNRLCELGFDMVYGLGEFTQIRVFKSLQQEKADSLTTFNGVGATDIGVKYRFLDHDELKLAIFPSYRLDDAGVRKDNAGVNLPTEGRSWYLPLIVAYDFMAGGRAYTFLSNWAVRKNLDHSIADTDFVALSLGTNIGSEARLMGEVTAECSTKSSDCRQDLRLGWQQSLKALESSSCEIAWFASIGTGRDTSDSSNHQTLLLGLNIATKK